MLNIKTHFKIADLIEYEGPFLSLFGDITNDYYYLYAYVGDDSNRWLITQHSREECINLLKDRIDWRSATQIAACGWLAVIALLNDELVATECIEVNPSEVDAEFLPKEDVYLDLDFDGDDFDGDEIKNAEVWNTLMRDEVVIIYNEHCFGDNMSIDGFEIQEYPYFDALISKVLGQTLKSRHKEIFKSFTDICYYNDFKKPKNWDDLMTMIPEVDIESRMPLMKAALHWIGCPCEQVGESYSCEDCGTNISSVQYWIP